MRSRLDGRKLLFVTLAVNGFLFSNQGRIRQRKERDGLRLSSVVPKIQWASYPHPPTAVRLSETFTFLSHRSVLSPLLCTCEKDQSAYGRSSGFSLRVPVLNDRRDISKIFLKA